MSQFERFGYYFHPSTYAAHLGHAAVDVFLAPSEDDWYFPTQSAIFPVADDQGIHRLYVSHSWTFSQRNHRLAPGIFFLVAQDGDLIEGFSFGGDLTINSEDDHISCLLNSAAPFFDLSNPTRLAAILIPEFEAQLARLRAEWTDIDAEYDRRVAAADPVSLFIAGLDLSNAYTHRLPASVSDDSVLDEQHAVNHAVHILKSAGDWPEKPPTLRQLIFDN